jgi:DNA-binding IclR family transcriptional regulator
MEALKGSPEGMTPKELSYAIGTPEKSLKKTLTRMRREGHIRKRKNTFYVR